MKYHGWEIYGLKNKPPVVEPCMMEIPRGDGCFRCFFLKFWLDYDCAYPDKKIAAGQMVEDLPDHKIRALRSDACLAAYPNGATVTITPKEVHE